MRFQYTTSDPSQSELDSLPRLPLVLRYTAQAIQVVGLVDSGATVNVLPYQIGIQLGAVWDDQKPKIQLSGNLGKAVAQHIWD
jgi:hypothetical protein